MKKTIKDFNLSGKKVIIRVDFKVFLVNIIPTKIAKTHEIYFPSFLVK